MTFFLVQICYFFPYTSPFYIYGAIIYVGATEAKIDA